MPTVCYRAAVVCPMNGPPLANGAVLVAGDRVVAVGEAEVLQADAERTHHVDGVLLPAFVNAHTHLEHADAAVLARPGPAHAWLHAVDGLTRSWTDEGWSRSAHRGVLLALRGGAGTVGDVVTRGPAVPAAARAGLAGDSFVEVADVDVEHQDVVLDAVEHALGLPAAGRRVGVGPASAVALGSGVLRALGMLAAGRDVPLQVHAGTGPAEAVAIRDGDGPLAAAARERARAFEWLDGGTSLTPVRYLDACGLLRPGTSVVHGVAVDVLEARLLAERGATVVCCPGSDEMLQAGEAPLERYADARVPLALGTESPAIVPGQDLLAEAAAWVRLARARELAFWPSGTGPIELEEQAVRLATVDGARAMGWGAISGVLEPGRRADLVGVAVETTPRTVWRDLVEQGPARQVLTVLAGVRKSRRTDPDEPWPELESAP